MRSMGASKDENKLLQLEKDAAEYIRTYGGQLNFDFSAQRSSSTKVTFGNIKSIVQNDRTLFSIRYTMELALTR